MVLEEAGPHAVDQAAGHLAPPVVGQDPDPGDPTHHWMGSL